MQPDSPAAHSMDTCFFAVDRDGHVACFDTGEAGAVPVQAVTGPSDVVSQGLAALPRVEVLHDPQGRSLPGRSKEQHRHDGLHSLPDMVLMFLDALDPVREEIAAGRAEQVPASKGVAVVFRELTETLAKQLHDNGICLGCHWRFEERDEEEYGVVDWTTRGLFTYGHLTENWISGPYGRERQPTRPIHVDELPPNVRLAMKAMHFDSLCFADTIHIQPIEHAECESWQAAYVVARYTIIRPIPGKEADYPNVYQHYVGNHKDLHVEPPREDKADSAGQ